MGNSPNWSFGYVPTPAQWRAAFSGKQDDLGFTPVNRGGDTMAGRLVTFASSLSSAGFNITPGIAPNEPSNGDIWFTSAGIFAQVSGHTVGPISTGTVASVGLVAPSEFVVTGSPVTESGDLELSWSNQPANQFLAGPTSGASADPAFRALVGDDLPNPGEGSKGGVEGYAASENEFLTGIGTNGLPESAVPDVLAILGYTPLAPANDLSDVDDPAQALTNLGGVGLDSQNMFSAAQTWAKGADIASAATLALGADGNYFHVTGTTTITALSGNPSPVYLVFDGSLTLTHNGTSLILPGNANIATIAGDRAIFISEGSSNWRCLTYIRGVSLPYVTTNIVGTVSQSGGIPTGAIIEKGSNANGSYVRYADGSQTCIIGPLSSGALTTASGSLFTSSAPQSYTFPAAFASGSVPLVTSGGAQGTSVVWVSGTSTSNTAGGGRAWTTITNANSYDYYLLASGRWF